MGSASRNGKPADPPGEVPAELRAAVERLNAWSSALSHVRPGAVSFRVQVVDAVHAGKVEAAVEVWAVTGTGVDVFTLPPSLADELAVMLTMNARQARSGLVIPRKAPDA